MTVKEQREAGGDRLTSKEFGTKVQAKMDELTEGLGVDKLASIDYWQLNRDAIKLVQDELREGSE